MKILKQEKVQGSAYEIEFSVENDVFQSAIQKVYRKEVQKRGAVDGDLYMLDENGNPVVPYARVLIQNKHPEEANK